jgi:hypothetical protein
MTRLESKSDIQIDPLSKIDGGFIPTPTERDLKLSLIAHQVGHLLADAAELYGHQRPQDSHEHGQMLTRLQDKSVAEKAAAAAAWAIDARIKGALDDVLRSWEDHSELSSTFSFTRMRFADVLTELQDAGEMGPIVYWLAARMPERFCACGRSLDTSAQIDAGQCLTCSERTAQ